MVIIYLLIDNIYLFAINNCMKSDNKIGENVRKQIENELRETLPNTFVDIYIYISGTSLIKFILFKIIKSKMSIDLRW